MKEKNEQYTWGIVLKENNELIGSIGVYLRTEEDNRYEVGYNLTRRYWNNGYTTEELKCMMNYLTEEVKVKKFICKHAKQNLASGAVMKKVGFKYVKDGIYENFDKSKKYESKIYFLDIEY